jgi:hypothetical protein
MAMLCAPAWATHDRATQLSWTKGAASGEVDFTVEFVARGSYYGSPVVNSVITDPEIDFGDGERIAPELTVVDVDAQNDIIYTQGQVSHVYAGSGPYVATMGSCCRLSASSGHVNNGDLSYQVHTLVDPVRANSSPSVSVAPIVHCPTAGNCSFAFAGSGADPGNHLKWRLATPTETGDPLFVQPGPPFAPNAAAIDQTLGRVSWDTSGAIVNEFGPTYYSIQVIAEELNSQNELVSDAGADFFISLDDSSTQQPECIDVDASGSVDNDNDGLCDNWETDGIDANHDGNVDISLPGANPNHRDIFVEIDYMEGRKPQTGALEDVAKAFAAHGIALHFFVDEEVPFDKYVAFGFGCSSCPAETVDFDGVKENYFGASGDRASINHKERLDALRFAYHYVLYANELAAADGTSGRAELPGNDLTITLGSWRNGSQPPTRRNEAGTLMHELGHNLGLRHGGGDGINCKPNYLSVMNYTRQTTGFINAQLDYSDAVLPTLDENALNEFLGVQGPTGATVVFGPGKHRLGGSTGPIDWNGQNGIESGVQADVNYISDKTGCASPTPGQDLVGFDDWENLDLAFQATTDFGDGVHASVPVQEPEITALDFADEDQDGDGVANIYDSCPEVAAATENGCPTPGSTPISQSPALSLTPRAQPASPETKLGKAVIVRAKRIATFNFSGLAGAEPLRFECKIDSRPFERCRSPKTYRKLSPGRHTFQVRVRDALDQIDQSPAVRRFQVRALRNKK